MYIQRIKLYWFIYGNCVCIRNPKTFALIYFTALCKGQDNFVHFYSEFSEYVGHCSRDFLLQLSSVRAKRPSGYLRKKIIAHVKTFWSCLPFPLEQNKDTCFSVPLYYSFSFSILSLPPLHHISIASHIYSWRYYFIYSFSPTFRKYLQKTVGSCLFPCPNH